jgi:hypothetical protein
MKVKLVFRNSLDLGSDNEALSVLNSKIENKIIKIPCVPEKGMLFELDNFHEEYNFSDEELGLIMDIDFHVMRVYEISVHPKYLEVVLEQA